MYQAVSDIAPQTISLVPKIPMNNSTAFETSTEKSHVIDSSIDIDAIDASFSSKVTEPQTNSDSESYGRLEVEEILAEAASLRHASVLPVVQLSVIAQRVLDVVKPQKYSEMSLADFASALSESQDYGLLDVMRRTSSLHDTIRSISSAVQSLYGADFIMWEADMYDMIVNGNIPVRNKNS